MIYRMRIYQTTSDGAPTFREFFRTWLLPIQRRHGARLVGRWESENGQVVAVWEYDDREACERIQAAVAADPDSHRAQEHSQSLQVKIVLREEIFMWATM
jgi:hypothetical protein